MPSTEPLFDFITRHVPLTGAEQQQAERYFKTISLQKGDILVQHGHTCKQLGFLVKGVFRVYTLHDGKEITSYFNYTQRNPFVASFVSLLSGKPSKEIVECLADAELLVVNYSDWLQLYDAIPALNTFGRKMAEYNYMLAMERIASLQYQLAGDRYHSFLQLYPGLINQIPHHYIASYLGVTPESLSRIRKG